MTEVSRLTPRVSMMVEEEQMVVITKIHTEEK